MEEVLTLQDQLNDIGAGELPHQELPVRPRSFTPDELDKVYAPFREWVTTLVQPELDKNFALTDPFCNDPRSFVSIYVDPQHHHSLYTRQYKQPAALIPLVTKILSAWFDKGKIEQAAQGCPFNNPLLVAPKKDANGQLVAIRVCIDPRPLNKVSTGTDTFFLPLMDDLTGAIASKNFYSDVDLSEAFMQQWVEEDSRRYIAFTWQLQYWFVGCPYGLKQIPSHFQRFISDVFHDMPWVVAYIDNIIIGSDTLEEHVWHVIMVVRRLTSLNLKIKPSSVRLCHAVLKILGHLLSKHGVGLDPDKIKDVLAWEMPQDGANLRSFLGMTGFLSPHIRHYSDVVAPLTSVRLAKGPLVWTPAMEEAFKTIKYALAHAPWLKAADLSLPFNVGPDASSVGIGGILYQCEREGDLEVTPFNIVALFSKKLVMAELNYSVYKKELLAIVRCVARWHSYLALRHFTIITDHLPLKYLLAQKNLSQTLQQWIDILLPYTFTVVHRPGIQHIVPDGLTRVYRSAAEETGAVWGTLPNIKFVETAARLSSPSDALQEEAIRLGRDSTRVGQPRAGRVELVCDGAGAPSVSTYTAHEHQAFLSAVMADLSTIPAPDDSVWQGQAEFDQLGVWAEQHLAHDALVSSIVATVPDLPVSQREQQELLDLQTGEVFALDVEELDGFHLNMKLDRNAIVDLEEESLHPTTHNHTNQPTQTIATQTPSFPPDRQLAIDLEQRGMQCPPRALRQKLLKDVHALGHRGRDAMFRELWRQRVWWPRMRTDIDAELQDCRGCLLQVVKAGGWEPARSVRSMRPCDHWQMDLKVMKNPTKDGYKYLLVIVDVFSGYVIVRPLKLGDAASIAQELWFIFTLLGFPLILQSDNDPLFVNDIILALTRLLGVEHRLITAWRPYADGKVEVAIRHIMEIIYKELEGFNDLWPLVAPFAMLGFNNRYAQLTGSPAFPVFLGRAMNQLADHTHEEPRTVNVADRKEWAEHQEKLMSIIYPAIHLRARHIQESYIKKLDARRRHVLSASLAPGTQVMLRDPSFLKQAGGRPDGVPPYLDGVYTIVRRGFNGAYTVRDRLGHELERRVTLDQLKVLRARQPSLAPDPDIYKLDKLLERKEMADKKNVVVPHFLVKWTGYDEPTWEPQYNIPPDIVRKFLARRRLAAANAPASSPASAPSSSSSAPVQTRASQRAAAARTVPTAADIQRSIARNSKKVLFNLSANQSFPERAQQQAAARAQRGERRGQSTSRSPSPTGT